MDAQYSEVKHSKEEAERLLLSLVGSWEGSTTVWFKPGDPGITAPTRGTLRALPNSCFVIHEYETGAGEETSYGIVLYGFNIFSERFEAAWADSYHMPTNMMVSSGPGLANGFSVLGSYLYDPAQPAWGWRTQVEKVDADNIIITAFNITPDGMEYKGVETVYRRAA